MTDDLSAVRLDRYNKVGENTLPNIIGSMSGRTFKEFREECVHKRATVYDTQLDKCFLTLSAIAQDFQKIK